MKIICLQNQLVSNLNSGLWPPTEEVTCPEEDTYEEGIAQDIRELELRWESELEEQEKRWSSEEDTANK